jgi:hypothetical protein
LFYALKEYIYIVTKLHLSGRIQSGSGVIRGRVRQHCCQAQYFFKVIQRIIIIAIIHSHTNNLEVAILVDHEDINPPFIAVHYTHLIVFFPSLVLGTK